MSYTNKAVGEEGTEAYRLYFLHNNEPVSPFHDIPLWVNKQNAVVNMVSEIPRGTNAKMEISRVDKLNPVKQDIKNGKLRFIHDKYPFNYGALPQTWEDPNHVDHDTKAKGDNDPLDACEIGSVTAVRGQIRQVKVLGTWAMIDEGETDWKILCIDVNDPKAHLVNSLEDVETHFPGVIKETFTFLRDYKIPSGSGPNQFAFNGELKDQKFALRVVEETHGQWTKLINGETEGKIEKTNTTQSKNKISSEESNKILGN